MASAREQAIRDEMNRHKGGKGAKWIDASRLEADHGVKQWKPKEASNFVMFIPPEDTGKYFGEAVYVHYDMGTGNEAVLCPKEHKIGPCPICEEREALRNDGLTKEELRPYNCWPPRYLFLIVDTNSKETEAEGVQWWSAPMTVNESIFDLCEDSRTKAVRDISDTNKDPGDELEFKVKGKGMLTKYSGFAVNERDRISDGAIAQIEGMPWFDEFLNFLEYDELAEMLDVSIKSRERQQARGERGGRSSERTERTSRESSRDADPPARSSRRRGAEESEKPEDDIPFDDPPKSDDPEERATSVREGMERSRRTSRRSSAEPEQAEPSAGAEARTERKQEGRRRRR